MSTSLSRIELLLNGAAKIVFVAVMIYIAWSAVRTSLRIMTCSTEQLEQDTLGHLRFEIERVSCDGLAKDETVRVYVSDTRLHYGWLSSQLTDHRTLLFRYGPGGPAPLLPKISQQSQSMIGISVPRVSEVFYEVHNWNGIAISYNIGTVDYPQSAE